MSDSFPRLFKGCLAMANSEKQAATCYTIVSPRPEFQLASCTDMRLRSDIGEASQEIFVGEKFEFLHLERTLEFDRIQLHFCLVEKGDLLAKRRALEAVIHLYLSEPSRLGSSMLMTVIRFLLPIRDHKIKRLLLLFWEVRFVCFGGVIRTLAESETETIGYLWRKR